jgi:hypothetical protein
MFDLRNLGSTYDDCPVCAIGAIVSAEGNAGQGAWVGDLSDTGVALGATFADRVRGVAGFPADHPYWEDVVIKYNDRRASSADQVLAVFDTIAAS